MNIIFYFLESKGIIFFQYIKIKENLKIMTE